MRAGLIVKHQSGKAWGHHGFEVFLKGKPDPYYGKIFLPSEQDGFPEGGLFWGTAEWVPPKQVGSDDTLVNVAPAACMWMTSKKALRHAVGFL